MIFICVDVVNIYETAFKQISSNFFLSFISLYDNIYTWSIVVNSSHSFSNFSFYLLPFYCFFHSLSFSLSLLNPSYWINLQSCNILQNYQCSPLPLLFYFYLMLPHKISSEHTWHLCQQIISWIIFLDLIRWIIFSDTMFVFFFLYFLANTFTSSQHAHNFINVYPCRLHNETIFAGSDVTERSMTVSIYKRYVINPISLTLSTEHFARYIVECIITNTNWLRSILLRHFDRTLLMNINCIKLYVFI